MLFCFVTTQYLSAHASMKRAIGMAPILVQFGHAVSILMMDHSENRAIGVRLDSVNCVFYPESGVRGERKWKKRYLAENKYDVIIYNSLGWRNTVRKSGASQNAFALMEHCELESANRNIRHYRRLAMYCLEWWSLWAFQGQIGASRYLVDLLHRRSFCMGWKRFIIWSPYAVDADVASGNCISARSETNGTRFILHVGTVADNYGASFMVEGLAQLHRKRKDWKTIFVGRGPALESCRAKVSALGLEQFIQFPGFLSEEVLRDLLAKSDVFLSHLNNTEQDWARCPSKLYYYMAKGRPIVTTMIGENRLALGESGFYYDSKSVDDFAEASSRALDAGPDWRAHYSPDSVTWGRRTEELLQAIKLLFPAT